MPWFNRTCNLWSVRRILERNYVHDNASPIVTTVIQKQKPTAVNASGGRGVWIREGAE